jgi:hypothetical protein
MTKLTIAQKAAHMRATMTFAQALEASKAIDAVCSQADARVQAFAAPYGKGPMGLTPEPCRTHPTYRVLKAQADRAFAGVQAFNQVFVKAFKDEYRAHLAAQREALRTARETAKA